jgi:hypothetical protein
MLSTVDLVLDVNTEQVTESITLDDNDIEVTSITPPSASPILVKTLVLQLSDSYPADTIDSDTFSVKLV